MILSGGRAMKKQQTIFKEWGMKQKLRKSNETALKFQKVEKKLSICGWTLLSKSFEWRTQKELVGRRTRTHLLARIINDHDFKSSSILVYCLLMVSKASKKIQSPYE
jgi:hypothetical protein